jgi:hypothetical protein
MSQQAHSRTRAKVACLFADHEDTDGGMLVRCEEGWHDGSERTSGAAKTRRQQRPDPAA